ncbi:MAG: hypothetical protein NTY36_14645 [Deltaproteobacteria bacterium]|nr:hypothetical protein [Deltaproteobacteria bacterium]
MKSERIMRLAAAVTIITLMLLGLAGSSAAAPQAPAAQLKATQQIRVPSAQLRTAKQMAAATGLRPTVPAQPPRPKPFLTRLDATAYRELKAKAAVSHGRPAPTAPQIVVPATPITNTVNFAGVDAATAGYYPPATHGAAGRDYFAEVTNSHLDIYLKAAPNTLVQSGSTEDWLGATPGYFANPRLIYDPVYDRWIFLVTQMRTPDDPTHQYLYLAVSLTSDPTGDFYLYTIDVSDDSVSGNTLWDYPQLGQDRNAIIVTGDFYDLDTGYIDSRMFPVAKSLLYNSQAFTLNLFTGLDGTLAPPMVLDVNPYSFLVTADWYTYDNYVTLYALQGSDTDNPLVFTNYIPVPTFSLPPYAPQPGTSEELDTLDARFENASTQIGNSLFQVHTIDVDGYATPRFYEFDTLNKSVIQSGNFYGSPTSSDFNASIAANRHKDVFVTWSSTDAANLVKAQVRVSGRLHTGRPGVISSGSSLYDSTTFLSGEPSDLGPSLQQWGTYSAVCLDPTDPRGATAWIVNEYVLTNDLWGSRIGRISLPAQNGATPAINSLLLLD